MALKNIIFSIKESSTQVDETAKKTTPQGLCTYIHSNKEISFFLFYSPIQYLNVHQYSNLRVMIIELCGLKELK